MSFSFLLLLLLFHTKLAFTSNTTFKKLKYSGFTITNDKYCPNVTYDASVANDSIYHLSTIGTNYVSVVVTQYQMTYNSTVIFPIYNTSIPCNNGKFACTTATPNSLKTIINRIHFYNMSVMLKPQIDLLNDSQHWRGEIGGGFQSNESWNEWFHSYLEYILFYAQLSNEMSVELLSVSCELILATTCDYCSDQWRNTIIPAIRNVFSGELTVSANWANPVTNIGEVANIQWWDMVDYIGCDEYYVKSVSGNGINDEYPTMKDLLEEWVPIEQQMEQLSVQWNMSVIFTEIGYCSGVVYNSHDTCWANGQQKYRPSLPTNQSLYAQYFQYSAALQAMTKYEWFLGFFWWNWVTDAAFGGYNNSCMTVSYKPAELLLRDWYQATLPQPPPPEYPAKCQCWL